MSPVAPQYRSTVSEKVFAARFPKSNKNSSIEHAIELATTYANLYTWWCMVSVGKGLLDVWGKKFALWNYRIKNMNSLSQIGRTPEVTWS